MANAEGPHNDPFEEGETTLEKKCSRCGEMKSVESFYRNNQALDGRQEGNFIPRRLVL